MTGTSSSVVWSVPVVQGRGRVAAILILATSTALPTLMHGKAHAQPVVSSAPRGASAEKVVQSGASVTTFNIPRGSLSDALVAFSTQAHAPLTSQAPMLSGKTSGGLQGRFTPSDALSRLLQGSGLTYLQNGPHAYKIIAPPSAIMLGPVRVAGMARDNLPSTAVIGRLQPTLPGGEIARGGQLGILGSRDVMDTPFSVTSYTEQFIKNRQIRNIRDALKDDPSVRGTIATGTASAESMMIRGFEVYGSDTSYGGLFGIVPASSFLAEMAERVEVLRGPAALVNGMAPGGAIGGTINIVPKRAHDKPISEIEADYTSNAQFGGHADIGRRFGNEKQFGLRMNAMIRSGDTPIERNSMRTALTSLGADAQFRRIRLSADFGYQYRNIDGVVPFLAVSDGLDLPRAGKVWRNLGTNWGRSKSETFFGLFKGEFDLMKNVTAYSSVGAHGDDSNNGSYPSRVTLLDTSGNASVRTVATADRSTTVTSEVGIRAQAKTGPIKQDLVFSANRYYKDDSSYYEIPGFRSINVYNNRYISSFNPTIPKKYPTTSTSTLSSLAFVDTISAMEKRIQVTGGLRVQRVQSVNFNAVTSARTSSYDKTAISPSVLAVFKPWRHFSIYGNWIQGLQQGTTVGSGYANAGQIFAPYKSTQYEIGIKGDIGRFIVTADVFQISKPNTTVNIHDNTMGLNGEQRNRGLELNIAGELVHGLQATGGLMLLDPSLNKTQNGTTNGWRAPGASTVNFNMGLNYNLPWVPGLSFTSDVIYTSSQYIDTTSPRRSIPGWVRLDLGMRYGMPNPAVRDGKITIYLNVDNVTNQNYWNGAGDTGSYFLSMGAPRTVRFSIAADF